METITSEEIAEQISSEISELKLKLKQLNLMVIGKTGVGKSTLINAMFGEDFAEAGMGKPVTQEVVPYTKPGYPFTIYDWPGFELEGENNIDSLFSDVTRAISAGKKEKDPNRMIHCIWYCVNAASHRFETAEIDLLRKLLDTSKKYSVPVILVLTQAYLKKDTERLTEKIKEEKLPVAGIVPLLASTKDFGDYQKQPFGMDALTDLMADVIHKDLRATLEVVQTANQKRRRFRANTIVYGEAVKISRLSIAPIQKESAIITACVKVIADLSALYDLQIKNDTLSSIVGVFIGEKKMPVTYHPVFGFLRMLEPVTFISSSVMSVGQLSGFVASIGECYLRICEALSAENIEEEYFLTEEGEAKLLKMFEDRLNLERDRKLHPKKRKDEEADEEPDKASADKNIDEDVAKNEKPDEENMDEASTQQE